MVFTEITRHLQHGEAAEIPAIPLSNALAIVNGSLPDPYQRLKCVLIRKSDASEGDDSEELEVHCASMGQWQ